MSDKFSAVSNVTKVLPLVGVLPQFIKEPNELAVKLMRSTSDVVPLPLGPATVYLVHHPDHLKHLLLDNRDNYWKGPMFGRADILVGNGLVLSEGAQWRQQRKLMQPHFRPKSLKGLVPPLAGVVSECIRHWKDADGPIDILPEMSNITITVLLKWLFSFDIEASMIARFDRLFTIVADHIGVRAPTWFLPEWFPLPGRNEAVKASQELRAMVGDIINERSRSGRRHDDLLDMFLNARDDKGRTMSRELIIDEVQTIIFAGYDSTATAMTWCWQLLATHPEAALRAQQEAHCVLPQTGVPTLEHLGRMKYFERVFKETLRLHPPFAFHPRSAREADVIGTQHIKPGDTLIYSNYAVHRNPDFWEHPDAFYPDHFLPKHASKRHRFAYVPFGTGPRVCIGLHMAMLEAKMVFGLALRDYDLVRALGQPRMIGRFTTGHPTESVRIELREHVRPERRVQPPSRRERIIEPPPSYRNVVPPSYRILDHDVVPPSVRAAAEVPPSYSFLDRDMVPPSVRAAAEAPPSVRSTAPASVRSAAHIVPGMLEAAGTPPSVRARGLLNARRGSLPNARTPAAQSTRNPDSRRGGCPFHQQELQRSPSIPPPSTNLS